MEFWRSAVQAAEAAAEAARDLGKKGLVSGASGLRRAWWQRWKGAGAIGARARGSHGRSSPLAVAPSPLAVRLATTTAIPTPPLPHSPQEAVEATAEGAGRALGAGLHDKVGAGPGAAEPPSDAELEAFGITPSFAEFVRTLNYRWGVRLGVGWGVWRWRRSGRRGGRARTLAALLLRLS
jgi:hypothetical protein